MAVSYKNLWKLLIDKDLKKKDLAELAHISTYTINKLRRAETRRKCKYRNSVENLHCVAMYI